MPETPFPPGELTCPRDGEIRRFEPVNIAHRSAERSVVAGSASVAPLPPLSLRRAEVRWREIRWVGFAGAPHAPGQGEGGAFQSSTADAPVAAEDQAPAGGESREAASGRSESRPVLAGVRADAAGSEPAAKMAQATGADGAAAPRRGAASLIAASAARLRQRVGAGIGRLLRFGAATVSVGVLAVFVYQGSEHLAGLAGATPPPPGAPPLAAPPLAAPDPPATTFVVPAAAREAATPPNDPAERAAYYLDRAKSGDPIAQYNLAVLYARGDGLVQDVSSAASWFREAATSGNPAAQFNLGVMYERGLGVAQDMDEAVAWYRRAAERNYPVAEYNLAIAYAEGRGMPQDPVAAARWYHAAAVQGVVPAMVNFAIAYEKGGGVEPSLTDAYAWYRAAARRGDVDAEKRARELFQQFTGAAKGQAVMQAAAVVDKLREPSAKPPKAPARAAGEGGAIPAPALKPGSWAGREPIDRQPGPRQPPG